MRRCKNDGFDLLGGRPAPTRAPPRGDMATLYYDLCQHVNHYRENARNQHFYQPDSQPREWFDGDRAGADVALKRLRVRSTLSSRYGPSPLGGHQNRARSPGPSSS